MAIRVLIVEDSITQREILVRLLNVDKDFRVVAEARNGHEAIKKVLEIAPDVVLMDIHMPDMDGIEATRQIMQRCPVPIVVASATLKKRDVDLALQALEAGAIAVIPKPAGAALLNLETMGQDLRNELMAAAQAKLPRPLSKTSSPRGARRSTLFAPALGVEIIGVCASTGGPPVLVEIFAALPKPISLPILLVQHLSEGFEEGFARWLSHTTGQSVQLPHAGQRLTPGIWVAPFGKHLTVTSRTQMSFIDRNIKDIHCPSGDPLFESFAKHFRAAAIGVLLTGMGRDGANGLLSLKQAGGTTVIQDEASSLIWGMPQAGKQLAAANYELPPAGIAAVLSQCLQGSPTK